MAFSHLVAKALEIDPGSKRPDKETGSFYDCNICFDVAIEPVLTCGGHLFCWACFYQSGLKIPLRPKAHRVEGIKQQITVHAVPTIPAEEALRQIMFSIKDGAYNYEAEPQPVGGPRVRVHQISRVLSESAASLSSLSSTLNSAERLVEELETVISNRMAAQNRSARNSTVLQSDEQQAEDSTSDFSAALRVDRPSGSTDVSGSDARFLARRTSRRSIMSRNYTDLTVINVVMIIVVFDNKLFLSQKKDILTHIEESKHNLKQPSETTLHVAAFRFRFYMELGTLDRHVAAFRSGFYMRLGTLDRHVAAFRSRFYMELGTIRQILFEPMFDITFMFLIKSSEWHIVVGFYLSQSANKV
ncbi:E3 ubiquitin-protein ligase rma3 [Phtheirospermum japonicum]|uniref:E3 ubiquitin-protein ligase RMA n=1 Tax=Phtheirospermum japonicum TaxID=374723 RepID=A0A830DBX1_9LAMI|nr:E3 ubiquitin-protein ligase rma3 [Phtheirospermum japonicum]